MALARTEPHRALPMNADELDAQCINYGLVYSDAAIRLLVRPSLPWLVRNRKRTTERAL